MSRAKIAIVDDEVDFLEVLQIFIEDDPGFSAFDIKFFSSGHECLKSIQEFDYLLTDINMPNMDGYQLIMEAKKIHPSIKTSVMSAYSDDANREKARLMGTLSYFVKPLDFDVIRIHLCSVFKINS